MVVVGTGVNIRLIVCGEQSYTALARMLRTNTLYLSKALPFLAFNDIAPIVKVVVYSLFGERFQAREELLLLTLIKVRALSPWLLVNGRWRRVDDTQCVGVGQATMDEHTQRCSDIDQLIRQNNCVSKLLGAYTWRTGGKAYLNSTLRDVVTAIISDADLNLEIDPANIAKSLGLAGLQSEEELGAHADVQAVLAQHVQALAATCARILDQVVSTVAQLPFGVRWVAKQLALYVLLPCLLDLRVCVDAPMVSLWRRLLTIRVTIVPGVRRPSSASCRRKTRVWCWVLSYSCGLSLRRLRHWRRFGSRAAWCPSERSGISLW